MPSKMLQPVTLCVLSFFLVVGSGENLARLSHDQDISVDVHVQAGNVVVTKNASSPEEGNVDISISAAGMASDNSTAPTSGQYPCFLSTLWLTFWSTISSTI